MEKTLCTVLNAVHERQIEEKPEALFDLPNSF
jgi:hypothetical protein